MKTQDKFWTLVEIVRYGIDWVNDIDNDSYVTGGIETVAHQIACCICQWYNIKAGVPTCETRDYLELNTMTRERLEKDFPVILQRYIAELQAVN
jgi:dihydropteroate synthase